jgi:hypothetical protein
MHRQRDRGDETMIVKFTQTREELNPEKKTKLGPDKMKTETFDKYVNTDTITDFDSGEFGQGNVAHEVKTRIHTIGGGTILVDQSAEEVAKVLGYSAKKTKDAPAAE